MQCNIYHHIIGNDIILFNVTVYTRVTGFAETIVIAFVINAFSLIIAYYTSIGISISTFISVDFAQISSKASIAFAEPTWNGIQMIEFTLSSDAIGPTSTSIYAIVTGGCTETKLIDFSL